MNSFYRFFSGLLLLLVAAYASAQAQSLWYRAYPISGVQTFGGIHCLRDETVLLHGNSVDSGQPACLFLLRTNAQGDTLRTRRFRIRGYDRFSGATMTAEDGAGRVLVAGQVLQGSNFTTLATFAALVNVTTGDTLWTRVVPGTTVLNDVACAPNQEYVLASQVQGHPTITRFSASGQLLHQTTLDYSPTVAGDAGRMVRGAGGYWLTVSNAAANPVGVKFLSDAGTPGTAYSLPAAVQRVTDLIAVEDGNFFMVTASTGLNGSIYKFSPTFSMLWSSGASGRQIGRAMRNTNGEYVLTSVRDTGGHGQETSLVSFSPQGTFLSSFPISVYPSYGISVHPTSGNYYVGTSSSSSADDFALTVYRGVAVTAATPQQRWTGQFYPNPVGATEVLHLAPPAPLAGALVLTDMQGRTVRQWPAQPAALRYELPLQGLSAGLYQLRLTDQQGQPAVLRVVKE